MNVLQIANQATNHKIGDKYHPAFWGADGSLYFWPNITHNNPRHATAAAEAALGDAHPHLNRFAKDWNLDTMSEVANVITHMRTWDEA